MPTSNRTATPQSSATSKRPAHAAIGTPAMQATKKAHAAVCASLISCSLRSVDGASTGSVDDEQRRADSRRRAVRLGAVGDLIGHARPQDEAAAVRELGVELAGEAEQDVALGTPVVGGVARAVVDHADAESVEGARALGGGGGRAG